MEKSDLCRLCALKKNNQLFIFGEEGIKLSIEDKIKKCLNIQINEQNSLPTSVCIDCYTKLNAFDEFLETTRTAQSTLNIIFSEQNVNNINTVSDESLKEVENTEEDGFDESESFNIENITEENVNRSNDYDQCHPEDVPLADAYNKTVLNEADNISSNTNTNNDLKLDTQNNKDWDLQTWLCSDCSEELPNAEQLRLHHATEHKQEPKYMCIYCSKLFLLYTTFITHLRRHRITLKYNCHECGKGFSNKKVLDAHALTHSDARPYACQDCGKSFRQQSALFIHSRCHLPDDVKNKFPCNLCNKRFSTKPNLVTHMRIHAGVRNFTCDQCGKSFVQKGNLDAHLLTHSQDKPFSCELCNKRFKTGMQLRKHHSVHTGAKPHQCDICGRTFREKGTLREHHRIHTGAMPFSCEFCGKSFRFKGILTTHRRQHTGERPYSCHECQHYFTNWPNYNKHMKRRHGINTSRSTRMVRESEGEGGGECQLTNPGSHGYQELPTGPEVYQPQPPLSPYMYGTYSFAQVPIDPIPI